MEAIKELNIFQRMAQATSEIETVAKNLAVQVTKTSSYKAVGEKDILDAVKPIESKYGIYSFPVSRKIIESGIQERETQYGVNKQLFMRLEVVYRFVNIDDPEDYIEVTSYGDGIDSGDKATGKAMTYADKYALMKAYKISTGDDPDKEDSTKLTNEQKQETEAKMQSPKPETERKATAKQVEIIATLYKEEEIKKMLENLHKKELKEITIDQASKMIAARKGK